MNDAHLIRAPQGAIAWTAVDGYAFDDSEVPRRVEAGELVLVVSDDGYLRGVQPHDRVPLSAVLRLDGDVVDVVSRLDELGDELHAQLEELTRLHARLAERVSDLGDAVAEELAVEVSALKGRLRRLEERSR